MVRYGRDQPPAYPPLPLAAAALVPLDLTNAEGDYAALVGRREAAEVPARDDRVDEERSDAAGGRVPGPDVGDFAECVELRRGQRPNIVHWCSFRVHCSHR